MISKSIRNNDTSDELTQSARIMAAAALKQEEENSTNALAGADEHLEN